MKAWKDLLARTKSRTAGLIESSRGLSPWGQLLYLECPDGVEPAPNAVGDKLSPYGDGRMPYVGIVIDLSGTSYRFSSIDLGSVVGSIAARVRGWVAPCAIVLTDGAASDLQKVLDVTKLNDIEALRIVASAEQALAHITHHLERRGQ